MVKTGGLFDEPPTCGAQNSCLAACDLCSQTLRRMSRAIDLHEPTSKIERQTWPNLINLINLIDLHPCKLQAQHRSKPRTTFFLQAADAQMPCLPPSFPAVNLKTGGALSLNRDLAAYVRQGLAAVREVSHNQTRVQEPTQHQWERIKRSDFHIHCAF